MKYVWEKGKGVILCYMYVVMGKYSWISDVLYIIYVFLKIKYMYIYKICLYKVDYFVDINNFFKNYV